MKKNVSIVAVTTIVILLIPLIAMQFSDEWDWKQSDFIIMGTLIFITGLAISWVMNMKNNKHRYLLVGVILFGFLLLWAEMAVGVFNTPIAGS